MTDRCSSGVKPHATPWAIHSGSSSPTFAISCPTVHTFAKKVLRMPDASSSAGPPNAWISSPRARSAGSAELYRRSNSSKADAST